MAVYIVYKIVTSTTSSIAGKFEFYILALTSNSIKLIPLSQRPIRRVHKPHTGIIVLAAASLLARQGRRASNLASQGKRRLAGQPIKVDHNNIASFSNIVLVQYIFGALDFAVVILIFLLPFKICNILCSTLAEH